MNFDISKTHVAAAIFLGVLLGVWQYQCDVNEQEAREQAEAEEAEEGTPEERIAHTTAEEAVYDAHQEGFERALRGARRELHGAEREREDRADKKRPDGDVLSLVFSGNIHGELEDCGCKSNPLGGLARRQTLVEYARDPQADGARKWWSEDLVEPDALFTVDAGDLLYRSPSLDKRPERLQKKAQDKAATLVEALAVDPPDALNVGQLDLMFGLDAYRDLVDGTDLPVVSANLYDAESERPFEGHRVVERDGFRVAIVGLLNPKGPGDDFYEKRDIEVKDPVEAYRDEVAELSEDVDFVVLASNLGINDSSKLVEEVRGDDVRLDAVVVSNTKRLTRTPHWSAGRPLVEPQARGKYLGRLDVHLDDDGTIEYANARVDTQKRLADYQKAWDGYVDARRRRGETEREIAELQRRLEGDEDVEEGGEESNGEDGRLDGDERSKLESKIENLRKRRDTLDKRVETASSDLARQSSSLPSVDEVARGASEEGDWAETTIAPLELDIPQQEKVRALLDEAEGEEG
ncbi:MAG: hypothetical protein ACOCV2_05295 [Persicimonas sp.]